jgi:hypothetical protein
MSRRAHRQFQHPFIKVSEPIFEKKYLNLNFAFPLIYTNNKFHFERLVPKLETNGHEIDDENKVVFINENDSILCFMYIIIHCYNLHAYVQFNTTFK